MSYDNGTPQPLPKGAQARCVLPGEKVISVRCAPKTYPCPNCGRRGRRKRRLQRRVRSLAYQQAAWLDVT